MIGIEHFAVFVLSCVLLNITPGNDTLYILGRTISQGRRAGVLSVAGIITGAAIHTAFAATGLSLILMKSATVFNVIKWVGAAYLIYLGIRSLLTKSAEETRIEVQDKSMHRRIYMQGLLTNVLNPKVALFYLAFMPQFISPDNAFGSLPFLALGLTFITTGTIWCLLLVAASDFMTRKVRKGGLTVWLNRITGAVFIGLGIKLLRTNNGS
ncbi:LysE family translocator [Cohnella sp. GCM10027633]|uniref:LysE family translocator n=1 Tax=unclassified Cohnella TaxID=2636738 RepID=UPI003633CE95